MGILDTSEIEDKEASTEEVKEGAQPEVKEVIKVEKVVEKVVEHVPTQSIEARPKVDVVDNAVETIRRELIDMEIQTDDLAPPPLPSPPQPEINQQLLD